MNGLIIRDETPRDRSAVRNVNDRSFGQPAESNLVEALHDEGAAIIALVAEMEDEIIGHILFSPVQVEVNFGKRLLGLAPMSVLPEHQRRGVGSQLIRAGLERCTAAGYDGVVVLGHPEYYPKFGFQPAHLFGLRCEYDVPPEVFMARELPPRTLKGVEGLVRYHHAFADA